MPDKKEKTLGKLSFGEKESGGPLLVLTTYAVEHIYIKIFLIQQKYMQ